MGETYNSMRYASMERRSDYLKRHWGWFLALGILLTIGGIVALSFTIGATLLSVMVLGLILFGAGIVQVVEGIQTRKWNGFFVHLALGVLYIFSGAVMFINPAIAAASLTLLLAVFYFTVGIFRMAASVAMRFHHWGWIFFSGMVSLTLAVLISISWPMSGLWIIGLFIGIDLLIYGVSMLAFAYSVKKLPERKINKG